MQVGSAGRSDKIVGLLLVLVFCLVGLLTLDDYGLTFDETWHFFAGDRYLRFWMTWDGSLMDFSQPHPTDVQPDDHPRFDRRDNEPRPAVANTLSSLSKWVFFTKLRWLDPVDAHHLAVILMAGGTLAVVYALGREAYGRFAAVFATLALGLSPRFLAHAHFNVKDVPKTLFFSLTVWAFWKAATRRDWRWMLGSAAFFGLALGTRVNAVLIPFVILPWLIAVLLTREMRKAPPPRRWWVTLLVYPLIIGIVWVITWPLMLVSPIETARRFVDHWVYLGTGAHSISTWSPYGVLYALVTTPLVVLLPALLGGVVATRELFRDPRRTGLLLLLWAGVPIFRTALPGATNYDGIRQFLEFLPAFCLLAGFGVQRLLEALQASLRRSVRQGVLLVFLCCAFVPILIKIVQIHPYELVYFNPLVGGLAGARRMGIPQSMDYWGSSHRQGLAWLNANAEPGARLYVGDGNINMVKPVSNIWLRGDITLLTSETLEDAMPASFYVAHIARLHDPVDRYCEVNLEPIYAIHVDGVSIYNVFYLEASQWQDLGEYLAEGG